ncbi:HAD family hydrolase [Bacillus sp. JJ664]
MIRAVVLDLDDTLILEKDYVFSGYQVVSEKIANDFNVTQTIVFEKMCLAFTKRKSKVFNRVLDELNLHYNQSYILELLKLYRGHKPEIHLLDDAKELLSLLKQKNYKLGIITDGYKESQQRKIETLHLGKYVDEIIITDEFGRKYWKPHMKSFQLMQERLKVPYSEMVYVGDNLKKDFIMPKQLGFTTICIRRSDGIYFHNEMDTEAYQPHTYVENLLDVLKVIE